MSLESVECRWWPGTELEPPTPAFSGLELTNTIYLRPLCLAPFRWSKTAIYWDHNGTTFLTQPRLDSSSVSDRKDTP